ncbi:MAG TPA: acylphosphatase [Nitrospiraceae bacterium]|nr:acylphosphatase [Nitrospiraceae bacterium]
MNDPASDELVRAKLLITGHVQGVGYRAFARHAASRRGLVGGVKNLDDGGVEAEVEGMRSVVEAMIRELKIGPPGARVQAVQVEWAPASGRFTGFHIWY